MGAPKGEGEDLLRREGCAPSPALCRSEGFMIDRRGLSVGRWCALGCADILVSCGGGGGGAHVLAAHLRHGAATAALTMLVRRGMPHRPRTTQSLAHTRT